MNPHTLTHTYLFVYKITNLINAKIYIGQHRTNDINDGYLGSGLLLQRAIKKYGVDKFLREILVYCESIEEANDKEKYFITQFNSTNKKLGYNIAPNAFGGQPITEAAKKKISVKLKGRTLSQEHKQKLADSRQGMKFSQQHIENMSKSRSGKIWVNNGVISKKVLPNLIPNEWVLGRLPQKKRKECSNETKEIFREASKKRMANLELREQISKTLKGHEVSEETREKIKKSVKKKWEDGAYQNRGSHGKKTNHNS